MRPEAGQSRGLSGLPVGAGAVALAPAKAEATPKPGKGYGLNHERPRVQIFASAKIQQPKTKAKASLAARHRRGEMCAYGFPSPPALPGASGATPHGLSIKGRAAP